MKILKVEPIAPIAPIDNKRSPYLSTPSERQFKGGNFARALEKITAEINEEIIRRAVNALITDAKGRYVIGDDEQKELELFLHDFYKGYEGQLKVAEVFKAAASLILQSDEVKFEDEAEKQMIRKWSINDLDIYA